MGSFGPYVDQKTFTLLGSLESKVGYFTHYSCKGGPEASASLAFP